MACRRSDPADWRWDCEMKPRYLEATLNADT
jgi:hypothetical protein